MQDMIIDYVHENKIEHREYGTIMDFLERLDSDDPKKPLPSDTDVSVRFFENPLLDNHFDTVQELRDHCKKILR